MKYSVTSSIRMTNHGLMPILPTITCLLAVVCLTISRLGLFQWLDRVCSENGITWGLWKSTRFFRALCEIVILVRSLKMTEIAPCCRIHYDWFWYIELSGRFHIWPATSNLWAELLLRSYWAVPKRCCNKFRTLHLSRHTLCPGITVPELPLMNFSIGVDRIVLVIGWVLWVGNLCYTFPIRVQRPQNPVPLDRV